MIETRRSRAGRRQGLRWVVAASVAAAALALAACSAPTPPRFHSLTPAAATPGKVAPAGALAWEVLPVSVPPGVDQPQWVVRSMDGSLVVLEQERWVGPLAEEIRAAVTAQLTQTLGPPSTKAASAWRVRIDVLRFETAPGREARIEAVWSLLPGSGDAATGQRCHGIFVESAGVDGGYLGLAAGHRHGVARLADAIGAGLTAAAAGKQGCA